MNNKKKNPQIIIEKVETKPHLSAYEAGSSSRHYQALETRSWPPSATTREMQGCRRTNQTET